MSEQIHHITMKLGESPDTQPGSAPSESWDDVPGLTEAMRSQFKLWDRIYSGDNEVPIMDLMEDGYELPRIEDLTTDERAGEFVEDILARIGKWQIRFQPCEHLTPMSTARMLLNEILPSMRVNPEIIETEIWENYTVWELCPDCQSEEWCGLED